MVIVCCGLLGIIQVGSSTALTDVLSLVLEAFYSSYLCVLLPLLYHRLKGNIAEPSEGSDFTNATDASAGSSYTWGPFRLRGVFGTLNNIVACLYLVLVGFFGFWPPEKQVTGETMNYSVVVLGAVAVLSVVYYMMIGRRTYNGPVVEVEAQKL